MNRSRPDIVVVSDLHLGRGKNPETARYYELEAFFYDGDFLQFCDYLCRDAAERDRALELVLNGDTFDLLRLDPLPLPEELEGWAGAYAPVLTPTRAAAEVERILSGHPLFREGLAHVLAAGHKVVFLPGNHDIEIQWEPVHVAIREALTNSEALRERTDRHQLIEQLVFRPWFYYAPGRIWIEHGCQYDPENAFRYPLRGGLVSAPDALHQAELDNPLGNFFQRYLYNAFGHITFIVPSTRANARYVKWLTFNQPTLMLRLVRSHWWFWWQVLRRVAKYPSRQRDRLASTHQRELEALAVASGLRERLVEIDALKEIHTDVFQAIRGLGWQAAKFVFATLLVGSLVLGLWFAGFHGIDQLQLGVLSKALLFLMFGFVFLMCALGAVLYTMLRTNTDVPPQPMRRAAAEIGRIVDVPLVVFGHTHDEVVWRTERRKGGSWYYNTGTWIAVFTHDVLMPRERVQFTFLRVRDDNAEHLHWSPGRDHPLPVVLLDEASPFGRGSQSVHEGPPT